MGLTIFLGVVYILFGTITALAGLKLFRLLLPLVAFLAGASVGWGAVIGLFGSGVISFTLAVVTALIVGLLFASLSFLYVEFAVTVLAVSAGAALAGWLAQMLGLSQDGFVTILLTLSGGVIAGMAAFLGGFSRDVVMAVTSFLGAGMVIVGLFLTFNDLSLNDLYETGLRSQLDRIVSDSTVWLFGWIGASLFAYYYQATTEHHDLLTNQYEYIAVTNGRGGTGRK